MKIAQETKESQHEGVSQPKQMSEVVIHSDGLGAQRDQNFHVSLMTSLVEDIVSAPSHTSRGSAEVAIGAWWSFLSSVCHLDGNAKSKPAHSTV